MFHAGESSENTGNQLNLQKHLNKTYNNYANN